MLEEWKQSISKSFHASEEQIIAIFKMYLFYYFMCMLYLHVYTMCMQYLWRPEEGIQSPGSEIIDSFELPCGIWNLNSGPLQE